MTTVKAVQEFVTNPVVRSPVGAAREMPAQVVLRIAFGSEELIYHLSTRNLDL